MIQPFTYPSEPSQNANPVQAFERVTVYALGAFGAKRIECRTLTLQRAPYAQHRDALHVRYTPKGARKMRGWVDTSGRDVAIVVVEGWGHPTPKDYMSAHRAVPGGSVSESRYSCFDPHWSGEMDALVSGLPIVLDLRGKESRERT